ncbi:DinB family protein [Paenibacillus lignilyticus]|uniref:DinB family protein n=1 Tax=Paenibacillus lignilyticus TaxID=1172615 RepID=A0ABS5CKQ3_9BACL|nr:DinB family protein [Paenibacillus lignilyticus]MBP3966436.1 DinB family protein [Paenibacillus lignilyticus]
MFRTVKDFIEDYKDESQGTQKLLDLLTDESLTQAVGEGRRTIGQLAWHLIHDDTGMLRRIGLDFKAPAAKSEPPQSAAVIAATYRETAASILEAASQWSDEKLLESHNIFGEVWENGLTMQLFIKHEVHHRGQLTVLMRQAGLPVAGLYGPSKEEWEQMGMTAPK